MNNIEEFKDRITVMRREAQKLRDDLQLFCEKKELVLTRSELRRAAAAYQEAFQQISAFLRKGEEAE